MFQESVAVSPTPLDLAVKRATVVTAVSGSARVVVSDNVGSGVFHVDGGLDAGSSLSLVVRANSLGRTLFGAKCSPAPVLRSGAVPFWVVYRSDVPLPPDSELSLSSLDVMVYPFAGDEDLLTVDTSGAPYCYVGLSWYASSAIEGLTAFAQVGQYVNQPAFFQPMKG